MNRNHFSKQWRKEQEVQVLIKKVSQANTIVLIHLILKRHSLLADHHWSVLHLQVLREKILKDKLQMAKYITKPLGNQALRVYQTERESEWDFAPRASIESHFGKILILLQNGFCLQDC